MDARRGVCGYKLVGGRYPVVIGIAVLLGLFNAVVGNINALYVHLPLFLDTIGTLVSTALFGLAPGLLTAFVTHILPETVPLLRAGSFPWIVCSVASAVSLWLFVRNDLFDNVLHVIMVSIIVTLANALTGSAVAVFFFSGITAHPVDYMMTGFLSIGQNVFSAAFWARIPINLIDKGIAVFIAYGVYSWCRMKVERDDPV